MIRIFKNHRSPRTSLNYDDYYPKSFVYKPSKNILELRERAEKIRRERT